MMRLIYDVPSDDAYPLKLEQAGYGPVELSARRLGDRQEVRFTVEDSRVDRAIALVQEHAPDAKRWL